MKVGIIRCQQTEDFCPGKRAVSRARLMVERGTEAIVFASCVGRGNPIDFACPHFGQMREAIRRRVGFEITLFDWTH
jgi:predicted metal-binding protein